jgi:hypothetical protein
MNKDLYVLDVIALKSSFIGAALYKISDSLISYSASISGNMIFARIVVKDSIDLDEEENVMDILGNIVGDFPSSTADFQLWKVADGETAPGNILPIELFHRAL